MATILTAGSSGAKSDPVPAGSHAAICYGFVHVGTQSSEKFASRPKIVILWEVPGERININGKDLPRGISKRFTATLNEKGTLFKDLQSWRGRPFTPKELDGFDMANIVGKGCLINVVHQQTPRGTFANVAGVMPLPKGMAVKGMENPPVTFNVVEAIDAARKAGKSDIVYPESIPQWIQDVCSKSEEYVQFINGVLAEPPAPAADEGMPEINEEVPF